MKTAVIRVDASIEIGSGHVMRCLTLAEELKGKGYQVIFVCRLHEGNMIDFILSRGNNVHSLTKPVHTKTNKVSSLAHGKWLGANQEEDALETLQLIKGYGIIDLLVIDHYAIDVEWQLKFRNQVKKILVIDDLADRKHDCDFLLDQNYYTDMDKRYEGLVSKNCKLLLGPKYALLRKEFYEARKKVKIRTGPVKRIFVFFGGSDPTSETIKALKAIQMLNIKDIIFDVIVGGANPHKVEIKNLVKTMDNVSYHCQISNMAELMVKADLAIGAGGSTTWERCYLGLPTVTITVAENQRNVNEDLKEYGAIYYLGKSNEINDIDIYNKLEKIINNELVVTQLSRKSLSLFNEEVSKCLHD